jgi:hypothetical protein
MANVLENVGERTIEHLRRSVLPVPMCRKLRLQFAWPGPILAPRSRGLCPLQLPGFLVRNFGTFGVHFGYDLFDGGRNHSLLRERQTQLS